MNDLQWIKDSRLAQALRNVRDEAITQRFVLLGLMLTGVIAYFIYIAHPMMHNHASRFAWLDPGGIGSGRWMSPWIGHLQYGAELPVIVPLMSVLVLVISAFLVIRSWKFEIDRTSLFLVSALVVAYPANLSYFYYTFMTLVMYSGLLFAILAYVSASQLKPGRIALGGLFVLCVMATYQTFLSVLVTVSVLAALAAIVRSPSVETIVAAGKVAVARALAAILGGVAYFVSLRILEISPPRSITYTSWREIPERVLEISRISFEHLWVTQPELLAPIKTVLGLVLVAAVIASLFQVRRSPFAIAAVAVLWVLAVIATKATLLVVAPDGSIWEYRYNFGLAYLYAFAPALLFWVLRDRIKALPVYALSLFVLFSFVQADLLRQAVLVRGQTHDLALANRILDRIEQLPGLDYTKEYDLVRVGKYSYYRLALLRGDDDERFERLGDTHMDIGEISDRWVDEEVMRYLGSGVDFVFKTTDPEFYTKVTRIQNELLEGRRPWPAPESVFLNGDEIIIYMRDE